MSDLLVYHFPFSAAAQGNDGCYSAESVANAALLYTMFGGNVSFTNSIIPSLHSIPTVRTGKHLDISQHGHRDMGLGHGHGHIAYLSP